MTDDRNSEAMNDLVRRLRDAATDFDGSQMEDGEAPRDTVSCKDLRAGADEIERLRGCLRYEQHRFATMNTHYDGCYAAGPMHYDCAIAEIERLRAENEKCRALYALRLRERAAEDVRIADAIARYERAKSELTALRKRVEEAEVVTIQKMPGSAFGVYVLSPEWVGKHVRLVVEE